MYTREEMENHAKELLKERSGYGCWGEVEIEPPFKKDVISANMIIQLLTQKD